MTQEDSARQTPETGDDLKYRFLKGFMRFFGFLMTLFGASVMLTDGIKMIPFALFGIFIMTVKIRG